MDSNNGSKAGLGPIGEVQQLYPLDEQRAFTCETAELGLNPKTFTIWPHQIQMFTHKREFPLGFG